MKKICMFALTSILLCGVLLSGFTFGDRVNMSEQQIVDMLNGPYNIAASSNQANNLEHDVNAEKFLNDMVTKDKFQTITVDGNITSEFDSQQITIRNNDHSKIDVSLDYSLNMQPLDFSITLPVSSDAKSNIVDGIVMTEGATADYKIATEIIEGGIRNSIIIGSKSAPENYSFSYQGLPKGASFHEVADGSIDIVNADSEVIASIKSPWAKDANGQKLETYYLLERNTITQIIEHQNSEIAYPIVADPYTLIQYFAYFWWTADNGGYKLSLLPSTIFKTEWASNRSGLLIDSWNKIQSNFKNNTGWPSPNTGMHNQYACHINFFSFMGPTNFTIDLETWRPIVSYAHTVIDQCNP